MLHKKRGVGKPVPRFPKLFALGAKNVSLMVQQVRVEILISRIWILLLLKTECLLSLNFPHLTFGIATQFAGFVTSPFNMTSQFT